MMFKSSVDFSISKYTFEALQNERSLDLNFKKGFINNANIDRLPNYKLLKQIALKKQLGFFYSSIINLSLILIPLFNFAQGIVAIFISIVSFPSVKKNHIIQTTISNVYIESVYKNKLHNSDTNLLSFFRISSLIRFKGVIVSLTNYIKLLSLIFHSKKDERMDLILHSRDAIILLMFSYYIRKNPSDSFITDDHYQRWVYLLSHLSSNLTVVQHGFIDDCISFKNLFGSIQILVVNDKSFQVCFEKYFKIEKTIFTSEKRKLSSTDIPMGILIASSFPYIDIEIELIQKLILRCNIPILIKLHPKHYYGHKKEQLISYATYVCKDNEFPVCLAFISYNSFLRNDYISNNIPTYSISEEGIDNTIELVLSHLNIITT